MYRKYWNSLIYTMGVCAICWVVLSLFFSDMQVRSLHLSVCILIPAHLFGFFTFELKLFSNRIWIRRVIVIGFTIITLFVVFYLFGKFRFEVDFLVTFGVAILVFVVVSIFIYYVSDKVEQHNLNLINQKLANNNTGNID